MSNPIAQFTQWLEEAKAHPQISEPTAMALATVGAGGLPAVRMVLLKAHDERGFVFYTNYQGRKGRELLAHPKAALCFYWMALEKQIRIEGAVEKVSDAEADAYFASRMTLSKIGAWASNQSETLESREVFEHKVAEFEKKFEGQDVPRPPHWSGFRVIPQNIEFWQQGNGRLHERELFERKGDGWTTRVLYP